MGHKVCSKKAPFANLANIILEWELVKILLLYLPALYINANTLKKSGTGKKSDRNLIQKHKITKRETQNQQAICELTAIDAWLKEANIKEDILAYGKLKLADGWILGSRLSSSQLDNSSTRMQKWFEVSWFTKHPASIHIEQKKASREPRVGVVRYYGIWRNRFALRFLERHGLMYLRRVLEAARLSHNVTLRRKRESMTMSKELQDWSCLFPPAKPRVFWGLACGAYCGGHVSLRRLMRNVTLERQREGPLSNEIEIW